MESQMEELEKWLLSCINNARNAGLTCEDVIGMITMLIKIYDNPKIFSWFSETCQSAKQRDLSDKEIQFVLAKINLMMQEHMLAQEKIELMRSPKISNKEMIRV